VPEGKDRAEAPVFSAQVIEDPGTLKHDRGLKDRAGMAPAFSELLGTFFLVLAAPAEG